MTTNNPELAGEVSANVHSSDTLSDVLAASVRI